jgi:excisionase family DNA binding protein
MEKTSTGNAHYRKTLISIKEAAEMLGLAQSTIRGRKAGTEGLTRIRHGRVIRLIKQEVEAHIEKLIVSAKRN